MNDNASLRPVHLVLLASEQLWPNLESMCMLQGRLTRVYIYHSDDRTRSVYPAMALRYLAEQHFRTKAILREGGIQPRDVTDVVSGWLAEFPDAHWVLNATGGTKLMTAGILRFVGTANTKTWYRELQHGWFELVPAEDGRRIVARKLQPPADLARRTNEIPVDSLLRAVWEPSGHEVQIGGPIEPLPVTKIANSLAEQIRQRVAQPDWEKVFQDAGIESPRVRAGFLFERFVSGCLYALGVRNAVANVVVKQGTSVLQEVDIVANYGGRVCVVDCTLRQGKIPVIAEYQRCETIRRSVAGLAGSYLLVRPNARPSKAERFVLSQGRITLLDAEDLERFCARLATFFGVKSLSEEAAEVDRILAEALRDRPLPGVSEPRSPAGEELAPVTRRNIIDLMQWANELGTTRNEHWVAVRLPTMTLLVVQTGKWVGDRLRKDEAVRRWLQRTAQAKRLRRVQFTVTLSNRGKTAYVQLTGEDALALVECLPPFPEQ